jgi:hypothetical protein
VDLDAVALCSRAAATTKDPVIIENTSGLRLASRAAASRSSAARARRERREDGW